MSTVYENTVDTLREVGERLAHDVPSSLQTVRVPSGLIPAGVVKSTSDFADDLTDRVGGLTDRVGGHRRKSSTLGEHPVLVVGGAVALVLAVVWLVRRRRSDDAQQGLRVADGSRASGAA